MKQAMDQVMQAYKAGDLTAALSLLDQHLSRAANPDPAHLALLGNIHFKLGNRLQGAEAFAASGVMGGGENAPTLLKLAARIFTEERRGDRLAAYGMATVAANPGDTELAFAVGEAMFAEGRVDEMLPLLASLDRDDDRHLALIVNCHRVGQRYEELTAELDAALTRKPEDVMLLGVRALVAREICDTAFMERYEGLLADVENPLAAALLAREGAHGRLAWCDDEAVQALPAQETFICQPSLDAASAMPRRPFSQADARIRVGYLSSDFFDHATMTLLLEVLENHDTERMDFVLLCYTAPFVAVHQQKWPEKLRSRIVSLYDKSDEQAAAVIDGLGIDILVDLKGHTMGARMPVVNLARAPVKAAYLGFPGTVVSVELDYAITDRIVTPDSSIPFYHEKLCRLPETYQANGFAHRASPVETTRAEQGLPEDTFVFASFNAPYKITAAKLRLWARILKAVPGSVLCCMCHIPLAARNIHAFMEAEGVARERVIIAPMAPYPKHLGRVRLVDLVLDTAPCNGHTTTSDMLWAGVPVLASLGGSFVSRVSASLLMAVGLPEFVATSEEQVFELAVALAHDPARLAGLRARIDAARFQSPLFDAERFARHLERAYEMMAERARAGLKPDHFDVPALPSRSGPFIDRPGFDKA